MTPVEYATTAAIAAGIVAAGNAIYQALKGTDAAARGDEGPIRVKGGSVVIDADHDDWASAGAGPTFKMKSKDNPKLNFWTALVLLDGVPDGPYFAKTLEVDMKSGDIITTTTCKAKGGIRVTAPDSLAIDTTKGNRLHHTDDGAFIRALRLRGGVTPRDFGPFTPEESKKLEVVLTPLVK